MDKRIRLSVHLATLSDGTTFPVNIYWKKSGHRISARAEHGQLEIYAFRNTSSKVLDQFIKECIHKYQGYYLNRPFYQEGEYIYCLGRKCIITNDVKKKNDPMGFYVPKSTKDPINRYKKSFLSYIQDRVPKLAQRMGLDVSDFTFRTGLYISYLGCCFPTKKQIKFDYRMFAYSPELIDYVFIHELTHLFEISHNENFHRILSHYCQDDKKKEQLIQRGYFEGSLDYVI